MSLRGRSRAFWLAVVAAVAAAVALAIVLTGGEDEDSTDAALSYVPADSSVVVAIETDLADDQYSSALDSVGQDVAGELPQVPDGIGVFGASGVEASVSALLAPEGINYDTQIKPVLGGELVMASTTAPTTDPGFEDGAVIALEVGSADATRLLLREVFELERRGEYRGAELWDEEGTSSEQAEIALDGEVLLLAEGGGDGDGEAGDRGLRDAIDRAEDGDGMSTEDFETAFEGADADGLLRVYANPSVFLEVPDLAPLRELPWAAALETFGATVSFEGKDVDVEALARTDSEGLTAEDLPLPEGGGQPGLVEREGEIASGSVDQSFTTVFLVRAAKLLFADSKFIADVEAIERDLGIDFEQEVLRQFAGPSSSTVTTNGRFAARSTVADPEAMRALLPRLAPRLPELAKDLDALGSSGLLALLFVAPDAPVATTPTEAETATPAPGGGADELLYDVTGPSLDGLPLENLPRSFVFGMVGDTFVVATDRERAREIAAADPEPVEGLEGASVLRASDLGNVPSMIEFFAGINLDGVRSAEAEVEADTSELRARLSVSYD